MTAHKAGNVILLECSFADFNGNKVDPDEVKFTIYEFNNYQYIPISEQIVSSSGEVGVYRTTFQLPESQKPYKLIAEFKGLYPDGTYSLERLPISVVFA